MATPTKSTTGSTDTFVIALLDDAGTGLRKDEQGNFNLSEFVVQLIIETSIDFPCIRGKLVLKDSGNLIGSLIGGEYWQIVVKTPTQSSATTYILQCHAITDRITRDKTNIFTVHLVSPEFLSNEIANVFGPYKDKPFSDYIKDLVKNAPTWEKASSTSQKTSKKQTSGNNKQNSTPPEMSGLKSTKSVHVEKTKGKPQFVIPNWRPLDTIAWMAKHAIREKSKTGKDDIPQSGFIFFENELGFHFKSLDELIEQAAKSKDCYRYSLAPKKLSSVSPEDQFKITRINYPQTFDLLSNLRNGIYSGYSMTLNLQSLQDSKMTGDSKDLPFTTGTYFLEKAYGQMSHLASKANLPVKTKGPLKNFTSIPKRIHFGFSPDYLYSKMDPKKPDKYEKNPQQQKNDAQSNPSARLYGSMRRLVLEMIQVQIDIPGNLDLRCGEGVELWIPKSRQKTENEKDEVYSGRYLVAGVKHVFNLQSCTTSVMCYKDYIPSSADI